MICLNPLSSLHAPKPESFGERAAGARRQASGRRLGSEAKRVRASGTEVLPIQPAVQDLDAMGTNLINGKRRHRVIEVAAQTVCAHLREPLVRARLQGLPAGQTQLVRRPDGELNERPEFERLARRRWALAQAG